MRYPGQRLLCLSGPTLHAHFPVQGERLLEVFTCRLAVSQRGVQFP